MRKTQAQMVYMVIFKVVFGCCPVHCVRRSRRWQTSWRTPVWGWKMRWTSTGRSWTSSGTTATSFRKKRSPCRRWGPTRDGLSSWPVRVDHLSKSFSLQLIDDLRRELEYLQCFKLEMEHPGKGKGLSEYNARTREMEMEHEVKRLKQVHTHLLLLNCDRGTSGFRI